MRTVTLVFALVLAVGVLDHLYATQSSADSTVRRLGLHQDKSQAYWLYFFIAHIYDGVLNPWHWTDTMRDQALSHADLKKTHAAIDVGAGTGFTSVGVIRQVGSLTMVDQSHAQLSKAAKKPELKQALKLVGDAENLVQGRRYGNESTVEAIGKYDRYTSAGSIEYWPHPEQGISEAYRVLKPGGKATIIGPVHPEWWLSKLFADVWYLFPTETEYINWFEAAGFEDVQVNAIRPEWYSQEDRMHGLIMGFAITGTRPTSAITDPPAPSPAKVTAQATSVGGAGGVGKLLRALLWLPRFVVGNIGGIYYAILPVFVYVKNVYCGGSALVTWLCCLGTGLPFLHMTVLPMSFRPLGDEKGLYDGIADFYSKSSDIWIQVWGEHMHSGFYGADGSDVEKDPQQAQHDMMEELLAFSGVDTSNVEAILDIGCGVGGSSRFLAQSCPRSSVTGVTLSPVQQARATQLNEEAGLDDVVDIRVENALRLPFDDGTFDLAWSLESGEHMPDKAQWLTEVERILKPGGVFVCVTWCHRETEAGAAGAGAGGWRGPLTPSEVRHLGRISKNYFLPEWVPLSRYVSVCGEVGLAVRETGDWTASIMPFWPAVIRSALQPLVLLQLLLFTSWATIKGAVTALLMMQGFNMELLVFGAFVATKPLEADTRHQAKAKLMPTAAKRGGQRKPRSKSKGKGGGSPSPAPHARRGGGAKKKAAAAAGGGSDSIYLYGHVPDASSFLSAFFRFSYPHTWVGTILSITVVTHIACQATTDPAALQALWAPWGTTGLPRVARAYLVALASALCVNIYIVGINQIFDVEIDRVNKPYLPLASGEWTVTFAAYLCAALLASGLGLGYAYGTAALQWTLCVSAALGTAYSTDLPGLRWKKYPLLAAGCILSVRSVIVQVGFFSHIQQSLELPLPQQLPWRDCPALVFSVVFILAFSLVIAFFKDLPDIAGDEAAGVRTLAVRAGTHTIFHGCVAALVMDYAAAAYYCALILPEGNQDGGGDNGSGSGGAYAAALAHVCGAVALYVAAQGVDLGKEVEIKHFYMLIWKCFYAEYLILLLL